MIGSLRGRIAERQPLGGGVNELLVDVGGVGYRVLAGARTAASLPERGGDVSLRVHTHVRESAITLYGFSAGEELRCFELLLGAHGVGPALALAVLSVLGPEELARAIVAGDVETLSRVPGVGRKTASRLVIDLTPRFESLADLGMMSGAAPAVPARPDEPRAQVAEALAALGYAADEVRGALDRLPDEGEIEELLRAALAALAPAVR
jgi:Holliday junction DNA helicase RuvA